MTKGAKCVNNDCPLVAIDLDPGHRCPSCGETLVPLAKVPLVNDTTAAEEPATRPELLQLYDGLKALVKALVKQALEEDSDPRRDLSILEARISDLEAEFGGHTHEVSLYHDFEFSLDGETEGPQ